MDEVIFSDDFSTMDSSKWTFNTVGPFIEPRSYFRQELPKVSDGVVHLVLDTYDPGGNQVFISSDMLTTRTFDVAQEGPLAFEASFRYVQNQPGLIGGFFTYGGPPDTHDEIDFEAMSNKMGGIQTNLYHNEPAGTSRPQDHAFKDGSSLEAFHTYRFEWIPASTATPTGMVRWMVDGEVVRESTTFVPTQAMNLHFNVWSGGPEWETSDPSLFPVASADQNRTFTFDVDWVKVERIATVKGSDASETLLGTAGNDLIESGGGNDTIHGGAGYDTAFIAKAISGHTVVVGQDGLALLDQAGGRHSLFDIESIRFSDQSIDTSILNKANFASASELASITDLYVSALDRAPDAMGLAYWASRLTDGMSIQEIAKSFFSQAETVLEYANAKSTTDFVTLAYRNTFERAPDADGLKYWVSELDAGRVTKDSFLLSFIGGARSPSGDPLDAQMIADKTAAGLDYAIREGLSDVTWAQAVMDKIDGSLASVLAAKQLIDMYAAQAATAGSSQFLLEFVGVSLDDVSGQGQG